MRLLYFDCIAGISGDMALGALIDAGADLEPIRKGLEGLPVESFELDVEQVESGGIRATKVNVRTSTDGLIRTYASVRSLLDMAEMPLDAKAMAQRIFRRLAEAEAMVHRRDLDQVTFHEVGAVDSIVDIVGTSLALASLKVDRVFASAVPTGMGMVKTEHGLLPIPAPAVMELLRGAPIYSRNVSVELVTPTGAAILAALVEGFGEIPHMRIEHVGYGAGSARLDFPERGSRRGRRGGPFGQRRRRNGAGERARARDERRRPQPRALRLRPRAPVRGRRPGRVAHPDRDEEGAPRRHDQRAGLSIEGGGDPPGALPRDREPSASVRPSWTSRRSSASGSRSPRGTGWSA